MDYAKIIKDAVYQKKDDAYIQSIAKQRDAKIASDPTSNAISSQDYLKSINYNPVTTAPATTPVNDWMGTLKDESLKSAQASIDKQTSQGMSNLGVEEKAIKPMAYEDRNQANIKMNQDKKVWDEYLASKGLGSSGAGAQGFLNNQTAYRGEIGKIDRLENSQLADIARRRTDLQNNGIYDLTKATADINAQGIQNQINQYNADRGYNLDVAGQTGYLNGQQTMQGQANDWNNKMNEAQYKELTDPNSTTNQMKQIGLDTAKFNYSQLPVEAKQKADQIALALAQGNISIEQAQAEIDHIGDSTALGYANLAWDKDPSNPKNQKLNTGTTATVDDYASTINSLYTTKDGVSTTIDSAGIKAYIDSLIAKGVDDSIVDSLAARYGITP